MRRKRRSSWSTKVRVKTTYCCSVVGFAVLLSTVFLRSVIIAIRQIYEVGVNQRQRNASRDDMWQRARVRDACEQRSRPVLPHSVS